MDTMRLTAIQLPDRTLDLLRSYASDRLRVGPEATSPARLHELPLQLRRRIGDGPSQQHVWFAWDDGGYTYLITGALVLELARERGRPVLEVRYYDHDGSLLQCGNWVRVGLERWEQCDT